MKRNTLTRKEFIYYQIYFGVLLSIWYSFYFFHNLKGLNTFLSVSWAGVILLSTCILFSFQQIKSQRNFFSVFQNLICGFGLYTILIYAPYKTILFQVAFWIGLITGIGLLFLLLKKGRIWRTLKISFRHALSLGLGLILFVMILNIRFGNSFSDSTALFFVPLPSSSHLDVTLITRLTPPIWSQLSLEEKIYSLQQVADIERENLGLSKRPTVKIHFKKDIRGYFTQSEGNVRISMDTLWTEDSLDVIQTIAHEMYHCYEHELCDQYDQLSDEQKVLWKDRIEQYQYEFENYISSTEDLEGYFYQSIEMDARNYSEQRKDFWKRFFPNVEEDF